MKRHFFLTIRNYAWMYRNGSNLKRSSFPLIIIQKFVGYMSFGPIADKTPYIFRCVFSKTKPIQVK